MPLFQCQKCGCVENTACGSFWGEAEKLCSECATGKWHGKFTKKSAKNYYIDCNGFIYSENEVDPKTKEWTYNRSYKMIRQIA